MNKNRENKARTYNLSTKAIENLERKSKEDVRTVSGCLTVLLENLYTKNKKVK